MEHHGHAAHRAIRRAAGDGVLPTRPVEAGEYLVIEGTVHRPRMRTTRGLKGFLLVSLEGRAEEPRPAGRVGVA